MNTFEFALFQGVLSLFLLSAPAHSGTMPKNMNEIMQALGNLYQDSLFNYGPGYDKNINLFRGNDLPDDGTELTEITVEKLCLKSYPICLGFEGTLTITPNDVFPYVVTKPEDIQSCYSDFKFSDCPTRNSTGVREKILDFSNVNVSDFCIPGTVELGGTLNVLSEIDPYGNMFALFLKTGEISEEVTTMPDDSNCSPDWDYCNKFLLDDFLRGNPSCHFRPGYPTLPCKAPVKENVYNLDSFRMNILEDLFEDTNLESGIVSSRILLFGKDGIDSCFQMSFNRTFM